MRLLPGTYWQDKKTGQVIIIRSVGRYVEYSWPPHVSARITPTEGFCACFQPYNWRTRTSFFKTFWRSLRSFFTGRTQRSTNADKPPGL